MSSVHSLELNPRENLARRGAGMFRFGAMTSAPAETVTKLARAKDRLYVLGQTAGWGFFLLLQMLFLQFFAPASIAQSRLSAAASYFFVIATGLLLTHYARGPMERWGWKELSWRGLAPRIFGMAATLSLLWSIIGYTWTYGILGDAWPAKIPPAVLFSVSVINGTIMMVGWLCVYFFYHVFERLQRLQVGQLHLAATAKEAELRALKSQVNPHFLFNSLNSLRALIDEDAPRARESVTRLANMLRYSLQSGQLETVPFEDELRIVEDYLALEQIRHENRLRVRWSIDPAARAGSLPPMLLQTLVENAVKYGISTRRGGGEIGIHAAVRNDSLVLCVTNPGNLAAPTSAAAAKAGSSTGVGLRNASERLNLLFGDRARLTLRADGPEQVAAEAVIPLPASR